MWSCTAPYEEETPCMCGEHSDEASAILSCLPDWLRYCLLLGFLALPTIQAARWLTAGHHLDRAKKKLRCLRVENPELRKKVECLAKEPSQDALDGPLTRKRQALLDVKRTTCFAEESASRLEKLRCLKQSLQDELDSLQREACSLQDDLNTLHSVFNKIID